MLQWEGVERSLARKPSYAFKDNRWLYVGFVALGVMAVWFGVLLGNFLLDKLANADPLPNVTVGGEGSTGAPDSKGEVKEDAAEASADFPGTIAPNTSGALYKVRVGTFSGLTEVRKAEAALQAAGFETYVLGTGSGPYYVQVGAFREKQNAEALKKQVEAKGYNVFVIQ